MSFNIRIAQPNIDEEDITSVTTALREGRLSGGIYAEQFEKLFAKYIGVKYAISVNSATAALQLMLAASDIKEGDEVITTPFTFAATANSIILQGAKPIFVDIEYDSYNIDPEKIEKKITKKTKAIMPIHYSGQSSEMNQINEIAEKNNLLVFEDAAPSAGATYYDKKVGGLGTAGAFSFFPDKNITTGEGGMLTTNSDKLAELASIMKRHGAPKRYYHTEIGWNFKMPDINAALGISQLKKLPNIIKQKNILAENYSKLIKKMLNQQVIYPKIKDGCTHTFNIYTIRFKNLKSREKAQKKLYDKGIETRVCFPSVHLQPIYQKLLKISIGSFPISEKCSETTLCLPMFLGLKIEQQEEIIKNIKEALEC